MGDVLPPAFSPGRRLKKQGGMGGGTPPCTLPCRGDLGGGTPPHLHRVHTVSCVEAAITVSTSRPHDAQNMVAMVWGFPLCGL